MFVHEPGSGAGSFLSQLTARGWIVSADILAEGGLRVVMPEGDFYLWLFADYRYQDGSGAWQWVDAYHPRVEPFGTPPHPELGPLFADVAVSGQSLVFTMAEPGVSAASLAPGLSHLATLHTLPGDGAAAFSAANLGFVEDPGHALVKDF